MMNTRATLEADIVMPLAERHYLSMLQREPRKQFLSYESEHEPAASVTGAQLLERVTRISSYLARHLRSQERVLLLLPNGVDYVCGLLACFYAGATAVPMPLSSWSQLTRLAPTIERIADDCGAVHLITDRTGRQLADKTSVLTSRTAWEIEELLAAGEASPPPAFRPGSATAVLLYTSGSTTEPKGILLSQATLLAQSMRGAMQWGLHEHSRVVSWLPRFHNFGLHFSVLAPLLAGASSAVFSPLEFMENPARWFEIMHGRRATHTAAPNFALDLCSSRVEPDVHLQSVSLRSLEALVCAGEPIRAASCKAFYDKFSSLGLSLRTFHPHYGLSEAGAVVSKMPGQDTVWRSLDRTCLQRGKVESAREGEPPATAASCGCITAETEIVVVRPDDARRCEINEIGEIWIRCEALGQGYLNRPAETHAAFGAVLDEPDARPYFRTGDLGFAADGQLFITGRAKEVIIVHGKNHYPADIENTVRALGPPNASGTVAFSCEIDDAERLILLQECTDQEIIGSYAEMAERMHATVAEVHGIVPHEIGLVANQALPRTGSGKIQRSACRRAYLDNLLPFAFLYSEVIGHARREPPRNCAEDIFATLRDRILVPETKRNPVQVSRGTAIAALGIDSLMYLRLSKRIEQEFGVRIEPAALFKCRDVSQVVDYIATHRSAAR